MRHAEKNVFARIDWITMIIVVALVAFGLISLASIMATPFTGEESSINDYIDKLNLEYVERQAQNFLIGLAAMIIFMVFDYEVFKPLSWWGYAGCLAFLLLVLGAGKIRGGTQGWFVLDTINRAFQPSEITKIAIILMLSKLVSSAMDKDGYLKRFRDILLCVALVAVPAGLVIWQPDMGTAIVYIVIMVFIFFIGRIRWPWIAAGIAIVAIALPLIYLYAFDGYQLDRITDFLQPQLDPNNDIVLTLTAIGSGQLWGKGFFNEATLAQLRWIRARHTDYIFAGIGEGLGFVGGASLIVAYMLLCLRWIRVSYTSKDNFGACITMGCLGVLVAHIFENIGMNIGLMPVTGIPLPFISYGGSNMLTNMICVGLVQNIWMRHYTDKHTRDWNLPQYDRRKRSLV